MRAVAHLFITTIFCSQVAAQTISAPLNPTDVRECRSLETQYHQLSSQLLAQAQQCYRTSDSAGITGAGCRATFFPDCAEISARLCRSYEDKNAASRQCRQQVNQYNAKIKAEAEARHQIAIGDRSDFTPGNTDVDSPSAKLYRTVRDGVKKPGELISKGADSLVTTMMTPGLDRGIMVANGYNSLRRFTGKPGDAVSGMMTSIALQTLSGVSHDVFAEFDRTFAEFDAENPIPTTDHLTLPDNYSAWKNQADTLGSVNGLPLEDGFISDSEISDLMSQAVELATAGLLDLDGIENLQQLQQTLASLEFDQNALDDALSGLDTTDYVDGTDWYNSIGKETARLQEAEAISRAQDQKKSTGASRSKSTSTSSGGCSDSQLDNEVKRAQAAMGGQPSGTGASANWTLRMMKRSRDIVAQQNRRCSRDLSYAVSYYNTEIRKLENWMRSAGISIR